MSRPVSQRWRRSAGIPLASYDDLILGAKQAAYIGRDPKDGGAEAAKAVVAKVPKGNYVLIGGDAGQTGSTLMQEGYHVTLDPLVEKGDIKIVMDQFTPRLEDRARTGKRRECVDRKRQRHPGFPRLL